MGVPQGGNKTMVPEGVFPEGGPPRGPQGVLQLGSPKGSPT
jgi:hypothetical protein